MIFIQILAICSALFFCDIFKYSKIADFSLIGVIFFPIAVRCGGAQNFCFLAQQILNNFLSII
jgi:hypothetical protein